jgi:glycosyltransferase involved in cell wall biosynthesis
MFMKTASVSLVSVIIVVKNDRGIAGTLQQLYAAPAATPFEVIVVDASEPSRLADIREAHPKVLWDQFPVSNVRSTPAQRNRGLALASGDIIAFIDANCTPAATWLNGIVDAVQHGKDIVCGPVCDSNPKNLVHYAPKHTEGKYVDICTTISVGMRREVVETVGMFDTSFLFGQDIDFFWRAGDAGYRIYYDPRVSIQHNWGERREQLGRAYQYGKARAHLFKKHWRTRRSELRREPHVWVYPLYILGLPMTYFMPFYPLIILLPVLKNLTQNPFGLVLHHLCYGWGVLAGTFKSWPEPPEATPVQRPAVV